MSTKTNRTLVAEWFAASAARQRERLLRHRARLCEAWDCLFPEHDFCTGRLRRHSLDSFERACDRADELARQRCVSEETLRARRLLSDDVSIERAWNDINDPHSRPTPQSTVAAILYCVRERGIAALNEPVNIERLSRCRAGALAQIDARLAQNLKGGGE
jgi:hypothetical protein